jgi:hypothetical protein
MYWEDTLLYEYSELAAFAEALYPSAICTHGFMFMQAEEAAFDSITAKAQTVTVLERVTSAIEAWYR